MLAYIQLLYEVEREARNATAEQRRELRQAKSRPILANYLQTEKPKVLPKSPMGVAIDYTLSNCEALLRYTEDGDLEIDNNRVERSLRSIVVGRRNWLFYGSDKGGRTGAVLSTLIASCKRLRIEPFSRASAPIPTASSMTCFPTNGCWHSRCLKRSRRNVEKLLEFLSGGRLKTG